MQPTSHSKTTDYLLPISEKSLNYLALGDSYTIGEGINPTKSYPHQAVEKLAQSHLIFSSPKIIAKTGWTTEELIQALEREEFGDTVFDWVSLLIGVNNQYRGLPLIQYEKEFKSLLESALKLANGKTNHVAVISIPDWGVTRFGNSSDRDLKEIFLEIEAFNKVNYQISKALKVHYLEITKMYRRYGGLEKNLAPDGLHPSPLIYEYWASELAKIILPQFQV